MPIRISGFATGLVQGGIDPARNIELLTCPPLKRLQGMRNASWTASAPVIRPFRIVADNSLLAALNRRDLARSQPEEFPGCAL